MKKSIMVAALFGCAIALLGVSCANESKNDSSANVSTGKDETNKSETDKNETDKNKDESDDDKNGDDKTWKEVTKFASADYKGTFWRGADGEMSLKYFCSISDSEKYFEDYEEKFKDIKLPVKMTFDFADSKVTIEHKVDLTKMAEAIAKEDGKKVSAVWENEMYIYSVSKSDPWYSKIKTFGFTNGELDYKDLNDKLMNLEVCKNQFELMGLKSKKECECYINSNKTQLKYVAYMPDPDLDYNYTDVVAEEIILKKS